MAIKEQQKEAEDLSSPKALVIFEAIRSEGEHELERPSSALAWSGLAAGLSMGFSMITQALLAHYLPEADWTPLITKFGYSIGFLIIILGRQQLFTENTLTPILTLLDCKELSVFKNVMRLWTIVFLANMAGTFLFALAVSSISIFEPETYRQLDKIAKGVVESGFRVTFYKAIFAGWLIAIMVWLLPFAEQARIWVIILITYIIGLGHFSHIVAGSVDAFYGLLAQQFGLYDYFLKFLLPTLTGNVIGGVALVAAINYAQINYERRR